MHAGVRMCMCVSEVPKSDRRKLSALSLDNNMSFEYFESPLH